MGSKWNLPAWVVFAVLILQELTACSGFGLTGGDSIVYRVTDVATNPLVVHVGDEVQLFHTHTGHYDGITLGIEVPTTKWTVSGGYFLDNDWYALSEHQDFDPHTARLQSVYVQDDPRWQAPAEPCQVEITCIYCYHVQESQCEGMTVTIDVLPAP